MATREQLQAALMTLKALADAIRELGQVPAGTLYANVMSHMSLETFNAAIDRLVGSGLVRRDPSHLLTWIEPVEAR